jgi:hypothetical protein
LCLRSFAGAELAWCSRVREDGWMLTALGTF